MSVVWAGVHTYFLYGFEMAFKGTARFGNVMMLTPIAIVVLRSNAVLSPIFSILCLVCSFAWVSVIFQFFGGNLDVLILGYVAIRDNLIRHMTVVGEPNVGGMLAVVTFVIAMIIPMRAWVSFVIGAMACSLLFFSLSKAAFLSLPIAILLMAGFSRKQERAAVLTRICKAVVLRMSFMILIGAQEYCLSALRSVLGYVNGEPSALEDFKY